MAQAILVDGLMVYPLEALLRPAYELRASCVSALGAGVVLGAPGLFLLSHPWNWLLAGVEGELPAIR